MLLAARPRRGRIGNWQAPAPAPEIWPTTMERMVEGARVRSWLLVGGRLSCIALKLNFRAQSRAARFFVPLHFSRIY